MLSVLWLTLSVDSKVHFNFTSCGWQSTSTWLLRWWSTHLPTSSVYCSRPSWSDGYSDRPPSFQRLIRAATRTTAANEVESEKIALYPSLYSEIDYESLTAEHTCRLIDVRFLLCCWISIHHYWWYSIYVTPVPVKCVSGMILQSAALGCTAHCKYKE